MPAKAPDFDIVENDFEQPTDDALMPTIVLENDLYRIVAIYDGDLPAKDPTRLTVAAHAEDIELPEIKWYPTEGLALVLKDTLPDLFSVEDLERTKARIDLAYTCLTSAASTLKKHIPCVKATVRS